MQQSNGSFTQAHGAVSDRGLVSVPSSTFMPNRALTDEDRELRRRTTGLKRSTHIIQATQSRGFRHHNRQLEIVRFNTH